MKNAVIFFLLIVVFGSMHPKKTCGTKIKGVFYKDGKVIKEVDFGEEIWWKDNVQDIRLPNGGVIKPDQERYLIVK